MMLFRRLLLGSFCVFAVHLAAGRAAPSPTFNTALRAALDTAEANHKAAYAAADFPAAIAFSRGGLEQAQQGGSIADQVPFIRHLAYDYWLMGDTGLAFHYSQRLLEFAAILNDERLHSQGHRYLSITYDTMGDTPNSRAHAEQALIHAKRTTDERIYTFALQALAVCQVKQGELDAAERAFETNRRYWEKMNDRWNAANSLANIADIADARGDLARALLLYEEIYATRVAVKDRRGQVRALSAIASLLRRQHRPEDALTRLQTARPLADTIGGHRILAEYYKVLAQVQEDRGDFAAALVAERIAQSEHEELAGERSRLHAADLEARLDLMRKQQTISRLQRTNAELGTSDAVNGRTYLIWIGLIDAFFLISVVVGAVSLVIHYRRHAERQVEAALRRSRQAPGL